VPAKAVQPSATLPKTAPAAAALEKRGSTGGAPATNAGVPPKPVSNQAKPFAAVSSPKAAAPKPAPPHPVAGLRPTKPPGPPRKRNRNSPLAAGAFAMRQLTAAKPRSGSNSEVAALRRDVCFAPVNGHRQAVSACPKSAMKRHRTF
jgi:hypothetical protein